VNTAKKFCRVVALSCGMLTVALQAGDGSAGPVAPDAPHGGRVGWARLINQGPRWNTHAENDSKLAQFIRTETTLNIDPTCYPVSPANLDALCLYPFIFTNDLAAVYDPRGRKNLAQYLRRGGFIYVDGCISPNVTPNFDVFLQAHRDWFAELLPGAEFRALADDDPIYRSYFTVRESDFWLHYKPETIRNKGNDGFYGVFVDQRMVALVSSRALQCAWETRLPQIPACERMIVNIYVYAMTR
jgi:hypothetical protein